MRRHHQTTSNNHAGTRSVQTEMQRKTEENKKHSPQSSKTTFNNQNTIVMVARNRQGELMLMHDTRIFYFELDPDVLEEQELMSLSKQPASVGGDEEEVKFEPQNDGEVSAQEIVGFEEAANEITVTILAMLTSYKYRILSSFYLLFRLTDNTILWALVISLFLGDNLNLSKVFATNFRVFTVLGVEVFYNVMEYTVKIWILNRVSLYVGFVLYGLYIVAFTLGNLWGILVYILFCLRFVAFISEAVVDYCIDKELEHDFKAKRLTEMELWLMRLRRHACFLQCDQWFNPMFKKKENPSHDAGEEKEKKSTSERPVALSVGERKRHESVVAMEEESSQQKIVLPYGWRYKGSLCVWTCHNVFQKEVEATYLRPYHQRHPSHHWIFEFMLAITVCIGMPLVIIVAILVLILALYQRCCVRCCRCCSKKKVTDAVDNATKSRTDSRLHAAKQKIGNICKNTIFGEFWQEDSF